MAQSADQFRRSDVVLWGTVAAVACAAALISANIAAIAPQGMLAGLHNSRVVNDEAAGLASELAAVGGSNGNLLKLAGAQQQMQTAQQQMQSAEQQMRKTQQQMLATEQQLSASQDRIRILQQQSQSAATTLDSRLAALEKTVAANGAQLTSLQTTLPRRVETLMFDKPDSSLVTGSIATPAATFVAPGTAPAPMEASAQAKPAQPMPAAVPPPAAIATAPAVTARAAAPAIAAPPPASPGGPQWISVAALPAFSTPSTLDAKASAGVPTAAPASPPYPMAPRPAEVAAHDAPSAMAVASTAGSITPAAHRPKTDVKAIGIAIGNPVTADSALANWQQIAGTVGVLLVGTSPLLADDPSGAGKVLVAGPLPGIAAATALCGKIEAASISCVPMPYVGTGLNAAASYQ